MFDGIETPTPSTRQGCCCCRERCTRAHLDLPIRPRLCVVWCASMFCMLHCTCFARRTLMPVLLQTSFQRVEGSKCLGTESPGRVTRTPAIACMIAERLARLAPMHAMPAWNYVLVQPSLRLPCSARPRNRVALGMSRGLPATCVRPIGG